MPRPALTPLERRNGQRYALVGNLFSNLGQFIILGQMMMLFANDVLGWAPQRIGTILAVSPILAILGLPLLGKIRRYGKIRTFRVASFIRMVLVVCLLALPAAYLSFPVYMVLLMLYAGAQDIGIQSIWQPLIRDITTHQDRGRFFGRMRSAFSVVTTVATAVIAAYVSGNITETQYKVLLAVALVGMLNQHIWIVRVPELPYDDEDDADRQADREADNGEPRTFSADLRRLWTVATQAPALRIPLLIQALLTLSFAPVMAVYLRTMLHVPSNLVTLYVVCVTLGMASSLMLWGRIADAIGFRPTLIGLVAISVVLSPFYLFLTPLRPGVALDALSGKELTTLIFLAALGLANGAFVGGAGICTTSQLHFTTRQADSAETMTVYNIFIKIVAALAAFINGALLENLAISEGITYFMDDYLAFDWFKAWHLIAAPILRIAACILVLRLPNARPDFGLADFFSSITADPLRTIAATRHVYHEDEDRRMELARWLGNKANPMSLEPLTELLSDPSYDVKVEAIRSLGRCGSQAAGAPLLTMLQNDEHRQLSDHLAWALGELKYLPAFDTLVARLAEPYPNRLRAMAARALGKLGDARAIAPLAAVVESQPDSLHLLSSCCRALLRLEGLEHAGLVFNALNRLSSRHERYELLAIICDWLNIPSRWLLQAKPGDSTGQALRDAVDARSAAWRHARGAPIAALRASAPDSIATLFHGALHDRPADHQTPVLQALAAQLDQVHTWSTLHVLAAAWLIYRDPGAHRLDAAAFGIT